MLHTFQLKLYMLGVNPNILGLSKELPEILDNFEYIIKEIDKINE